MSMLLCNRAPDHIRCACCSHSPLFARHDLLHLSPHMDSRCVDVCQGQVAAVHTFYNPGVAGSLPHRPPSLNCHIWLNMCTHTLWPHGCGYIKICKADIYLAWKKPTSEVDFVHLQHYLSLYLSCLEVTTSKLGLCING